MEIDATSWRMAWKVGYCMKHKVNVCDVERIEQGLMKRRKLALKCSWVETGGEAKQGLQNTYIRRLKRLGFSSKLVCRI